MKVGDKVRVLSNAACGTAYGKVGEIVAEGFVDMDGERVEQWLVKIKGDRLPVPVQKDQAEPVSPFLDTRTSSA